MIGWARGSIGNCARSLNFTIRTNGICTTQNPSWRMRVTKFSGKLRYNGSSDLCKTTRTRDSQEKKKKETEKYPNLAETPQKETMEHEDDGDTNCIRGQEETIQTTAL